MRAAADRGLNLTQSINEALGVAMAANDDVVVVGVDVGEHGGAFQATRGLLARFGETRVIELPGDPGGLLGAAAGMALYGLRPVVELPLADQLFGGFDQLVDEIARIRYRSGGQLACPITVRLPYGAGVGGGMYASASPESHLVATPGLVVVCPSTPVDAKGLLLSAIALDDPVVFLEPKALYRRSGPLVPDEPYTIPIGEARRVREGDDVTIVAWGNMVRVAEEAANRAANDGVECAIIDPRTLWPLDIDTIARSVSETGRCVIVHEASRTGGFGAEIAALVQRHCFLRLEAPIARVTGKDSPVPYALEDAWLPSATEVLEAIEAAVDF